MKQKTVITDKIYKLKSGTPLSYTLASRNHPRFPLLWFDEAKNVNRVLRYSVNQKSPFEDEQDGNAVLEPIIFEDGLLRVARTNPVLQEFLYYHPLRNIIFEEIDKEKDAAEEMEYLNYEVDALMEARQLTIEQLETLTRVMFGKDPSTVSTAELKRDILVFAKLNPIEFLNFVNDPMLKFQDKVRQFFENRLLQFRNNDKEVWFNTPTNKKKMMSIAFGEDPYEAVSLYLKSDEGIEAMKMLELSMA
tara:strand:- start:8668 stop:9411 length:744 start_codon:yes stop_codon:yes gene_type:complete